MSTSLPPLPPLPVLSPMVSALPPLPSGFGAGAYSQPISMDQDPWEPGWYELGDNVMGEIFWSSTRYYWTGQSWQYDDQALQPDVWRGLAAPPNV